MSFFHNMASNANSPQCVKLAKNTDCSRIDADFILKYTTKETNLLDLGSGTGLIVNKIYRSIGHITCIEPFYQFSDFIIKSPNIQIINTTVQNFDTEKKFDLITIFATMHYFDETESIFIYKKYFDFLSPNGLIIIKNQFGVKEDVTINGYSEEQKTNYFAQYRHINKEIDNLKSIGFANIQTKDIYPPSCNRWNNTHFYAIIASKNNDKLS